MPFIHLQLAAAPGVDVDDPLLARTITGWAGEILHKKPEVTAVRIERVPPETWFVGGATTASRGQSTVQLQIQVTAGTNSADEKAHFVAAAFDGLATLLGGLHPASYVVVQELPAESWGYGGRTQAARQAEARACSP